MEAAVSLKQGMTFEGTADSGFKVTLGADPAVGGDDDGLRPMELMLISLAGCTAMDVISILRKKRQTVTGFQVTVSAGRADEHPKVFTDVHLKYLIHGEGVDPRAVERSIELSTKEYCPAHAMLSQATAISHDYEIVETGGGKR